MIHDQDRSGWFGASDTAAIMGSWETETFRKWWAVKLGIRQDHYTNAAMQAGTAYEHKILDALGVKTRDRQIKVYALRLRVNYDGDDAQTITEVKTYSKAPFKVSRAYWMQCQVEMFASGWGLRRRKMCRIAAYQIGDAEKQNFFLPVDPGRISLWPVEYDEVWVEEKYLPRLRYLAMCLKTGRWPRKEEAAMQQVTVDAARWLRDGDGSWLAFRVGSDKTAMDVCDSLKAGKEYNLTLKQKGRSLDANAYFWVLVNRLADKLKIEPEGIYRAYIPDIGGSYEVVPVREDKIDAWEKVWCSGHIGRMIEDMGPCRNIKGYHNIRSYISSSDYDTAQMSQLIELVVADCKEQGIETMTPRELDALVSRWGEVSV